MRRFGLRSAAALFALGALLEPLGHQVAYTIHYGLRQAIALESQGSHAYFPRVASTAGVSIALLLAFGLLALGTVRLVLGPQRVTAAGAGRTFTRLAAIQCALFVVQETVEARSVHTNPDFLLIAVLALCAQLPVAALAAWLIAMFAGYLALTPLAVRVILAIRIAKEAQPLQLRPQLVPIVRRDAGHQRWLSRRGPPRSL